MPTFTQDQRHAIRFFAGYSEGFTNFYSRVEQAMSRIEENYPGAFARITNPIDGTPPGILARLEQLRTDIFAARGRFKASVVGSITLNAGELQQLRSLGGELAAELCQILGIRRARNVFSVGGVDDDGGGAGRDLPFNAGSGSNFVGK